MKKVFLILSILLLIPTIASAEIEVFKGYHYDKPTDCVVTNNPCPSGNFTDLNSRKEGDGVTYTLPKQRTYITIEGQDYTVLDYGSKKTVIKGRR